MIYTIYLIYLIYLSEAFSSHTRVYARVRVQSITTYATHSRTSATEQPPADKKLTLNDKDGVMAIVFASKT